MVNEIWGVDKEKYNLMANRYSKSNIFLWLVSGVIYNIYKGNLMSVSTVLLVIPGIYVISYASIPTFWMEVKKHQIVPSTHNIFVLMFFTFWYLIDLVYPVLLSIGYIFLIELIF